MNKDTIESYLSNNLASEVKTRSSGLAKWTANRLIAKRIEQLPTETSYREIEPRGTASYRDAYQNAKDAMTKSGTVLEEDDFNGIITGLIRAGINDMNPAVLTVDVEQGNLKITAYAKEGLIKQNTGEMAIEKFCRAL